MFQEIRTTLKKCQEIYQTGTKTAENPGILLSKLPIIQVLCLKFITNLKPLGNGGKMPKNIQKWNHKLPKITNIEKLIKMGTKMTKNLPNGNQNFQERNCDTKTAENPEKCG